MCNQFPLLVKHSVNYLPEELSLYGSYAFIL